MPEGGAGLLVGHMVLTLSLMLCVCRELGLAQRTMVPMNAQKIEKPTKCRPEPKPQHEESWLAAGKSSGEASNLPMGTRGLERPLSLRGMGKRLRPAPEVTLLQGATGVLPLTEAEQ